MGVSVSTTLRWQTLLVTQTDIQPTEAMEGMTPLHAQDLEDGRTLLLMLDGDEYPTDSEGPWTVIAGLTSDGTDFTQLVTQQLDIFPYSLAYWKGHLFMGMADGSVWAADGQ